MICFRLSALKYLNQYGSPLQYSFSKVLGMFIDIMEEGTYLPREITPRKKLLNSIIFFKNKIRNRGLALPPPPPTKKF